MAFCLLILFYSALADKTQLFPPSSMNSFDYVIRSNYTNDLVVNRNMGFIVGSTARTITLTFEMYKFINDPDKPGYMNIPKSLSVNFYITLNNGSNDEKIQLSLDQSATKMRLSKTLPMTYFFQNGNLKTISEFNGDKYDVYSLNCYLQFIANENANQSILAQITGIVSLIVSLKTTASSNIKSSAIYSDNSQYPLNINSKIKADLVDCNDNGTICNDNKTSYIF